MKTLQNNFTTPEQSKRLLELGVPADSADCVNYYGIPSVSNARQLTGVVFDKNITVNNLVGNKYSIPCWSVGRLMEICKICGSYELAKEIYGRVLMYLNTVDGCICEMIYEINNGNLDFSKLEE